MSKMRKRLVLTVVCLISLFAGPNMFAIIWGPAPLPLGTYRDVMFFTCEGGNGPVNVGNEWWDCLRHLHHSGVPAEYAYVEDLDCQTEESESLTVWCKDVNGVWHEITWAQMENYVSDELRNWPPHAGFETGGRILFQATSCTGSNPVPAADGIKRLRPPRGGRSLLVRDIRASAVQRKSCSGFGVQTNSVHISEPYAVLVAVCFGQHAPNTKIAKRYDGHR